MGNNAAPAVPVKRLRLAAAVSLCGLAAIAASAAAPPAKKHAAAASPQPASGRANNAPLTADERVVHLLNRAAFGPRPGDIERVKQMGIAAWLDQQLHPEKIDDSAVDTQLASFTALQRSDAELSQDYYNGLKRNQQLQKLFLAAQRQKEGQAPLATTDGAPAMTEGAAAAYGVAAAAAAATPAAPAPAQAPAIIPPPPGGDRRKLAELYASMIPDQRQQLVQLAREGRQGVQREDTQLVVSKVARAVESQRQLQEVMVDFWTNHFNIDIRKNACRVYKVSDDRDVIRKYAFGKFRDLLEASAKSPAMLVYLDNFQSTGPQQAAPQITQQQIDRMRLQAARLQAAAAAGNVQAQKRLDRLQSFLAYQDRQKQNPGKGRKASGLNENYAREIMELHTLGVDGGYTQKDVTEVARCLTGWTIDRQTGSFQFAPRRHDDGQKVVLGHVIPAGGGMQDGETVLDLLASSPATMRHVSYQLCQRFVSDTPPTSLVNKCVATWQHTDGDMREVVRTILTSDEFNSRQAYQQKIKSPFEYAVSAARALDAVYVLPGENGGPEAMRPGAQGLVLKANANRGYSGGARAPYLPGQIALMGEPLFQMQPPTGYPEDSRKWVSSGALISRLNFSLALTGGRIADVNLDGARQSVYGGDPAQGISAATAASPEQFVTRLSDVILHGTISPATRTTLLREADQISGADTAAAPRNVAYAAGATDPQTARKLVALVLGSPEFQRR